MSMQQSRTVTINEALYYDLKAEEFVYNQKNIPLRYKEKRFCTLMIKNINTYVSFENIYDYVWEGEIKESYPLRQLIAVLRKKLPTDMIHTKTKVGYKINNSKPL